MIYVIMAFIGAATFGLCFAVDRLIQRTKRRCSGAALKRSVHQPTRAIGIGIVLAIAGLSAVLFMDGGLGLWGGLLVMLLGAVLIGSYFLFSIDYDEEGFTCRTLRSTNRFLYNQIQSEQAIATRSGITVILYVADTTVELSEAMQGVREFLSHAYYARCRQLGIDPETCPPPAPRELVWFCEPHGE